MSNPTSVTRRAALCIPELVNDREVAAGVARHFGNRPTWVAAVSEPTHDTLQGLLAGRCDGPAVAAMRLGACRPDPSGGIALVLALQMRGMQLRCAAALEDAGMQAFLRHAARSGSVQMALGRHRGEQYAVFDAPLPSDNLQRVMALPVLSTSLAAQTIAVQRTAQLCQRQGEVPSLIAGHWVETVDVAVVAAGVSPFSLDGAALARIERCLTERKEHQ